MTYSHLSPKIGVGFSLMVAMGVNAMAGFQDDVGFTKLKSEYGSSLPSVASVRVLQVEYPRNGAWATQAAGTLAGKNFSYLTSYTGYSSHANEVGSYLGGSTVSMTPSFTGWTCSEATAFIGRGNLNGTRALAPITATWDLENHSWGGNDTLWGVAILQKQDLRIDRDNVVAVAGVDNGSLLSMVMANSYNTLAVGVSNGGHPRTGSSLDGLGRMKPDLVAPAAYTSYATPMVSSGAALLLAEIKRTTALAAARSPMVIKALLMSGATKEEFPGWTHSTQYPLDRIYGAGEFNIYNSYKTLKAGRQAASNTAEVGRAGWDANTTVTSGRRLYFFTVPSGQRMTLSAVLTWHRKVSADSLWSTLTSRLANLDLKLYRASGYTVGSSVATSASLIDNVEHIYSTTLLAGQYALEVTSNVAGEKYGLAWRSALVADGTSISPPPSNPQPQVVSSGSIPDSSFETVKVGANSYSAFAYNPAVPGWTFSSRSGLAGNNSGFTSGNSSAPDGTQVAFVQSTGTLTTSLNLAAGTYRIQAMAANRANHGGAQTVSVQVDGREVGRFSSGTAYSAVATSNFSVAQGTHEIRFVGLTTADCTLFLDQVAVTSGATAATSSLLNSGFEAPDLGGGWSAYRYTPAVVAGSQGWLFEGASGIAGNDSGFTESNPNAPEGKQVAFLQKNNAIVSQSLNVPATGSYRLKVVAAHRGNYNVSRQTVHAYLDGTYIGAICPAGTNFEAVSLNFSASAGTRRLSFRGTLSTDSTLLIDRVEVVKN